MQVYDVVETHPVCVRRTEIPCDRLECFYVRMMCIIEARSVYQVYMLSLVGERMYRKIVRTYRLLVIQMRTIAECRTSHRTVNHGLLILLYSCSAE